MAVLTTDQVREIKRLVESHLTALAIETCGPDTVTKEKLAELVRNGIIDQATADELESDFVGNSYMLGQLVSKLAVAGIDADPWDSTKAMARLLENPIELRPREEKAVDAARKTAGDYLVGIGTTFADIFDIRITAEDEAIRRRGIKDAVVLAVEERKTQGELATYLRDRLDMLTRDVDRVAATELQNVHSQGTSDYIDKTFGGEAKVSKIASPGACVDCRRLYIGGDGKPLIFSLADIKGNSNHKKKRSQWLPVVEATHPYCHCTLVHVPEGWIYNEEWTLVPAKAKHPEKIKEYEEYIKRRNAERKAMKLPAPVEV